MTPEEIEKAWNEIRQAVNAAYDLGAATKSDFPDMTPHYKALRHEMEAGEGQARQHRHGSTVDREYWILQ